MSGIKLRAKRKNTDDWLLFGITELFHGENGYFQVCVEDVGLFAIDPATIQLADDPRKHPMFTVSCPNCDYEYMDPFEDGSFECPECELYLPPKKDPRKAMLDELREQIINLPGTNYTCAGDAVYIQHEVNRAKVLSILDEMEAKL